MRFYQKNESGRLWQRNPLASLFHVLRDAIIFLLPVRRLPSFIVNIFYGVKPQFIFFIHPRRSEDMYIGFPPAVLMRRFLGKGLFLKITSLFFPTVVSTVRTPRNIDGLILSSFCLPEVFLRRKKVSLREAFRGVYLSSKLLPKGGVLGVGALWPMVTRRGLSLKRSPRAKDIIITNGHCGTLVSLFFTIKSIADLSSVRLEDLKVAILGVGKMGENLGHVLYGKVATLTLVDINEKRLDLVEEKLSSAMSETDIQKYTNSEDFGGMKEVFENNHIIVCTTSNIRRIIKPEDIPDNSIIIDDSRPEGIPRELSGNRVVLEGGLLKINGIMQNYDYGFGFDENVFGCLAESYLLAFDSFKALKPTLGDVDFGNFDKMVDFCQKANIAVGDFKCRDRIIEKDKIVSIIKSKADLAATIPYKNICWIFKVNDLLSREG